MAVAILCSDVSAVSFNELSATNQAVYNVAGGSATPHIGNVSLDIYFGYDMGHGKVRSLSVIAVTVSDELPGGCLERNRSRAERSIKPFVMGRKN